jgi:hypothetical protein
MDLRLESLRLQVRNGRDVVASTPVDAEDVTFELRAGHSYDVSWAVPEMEPIAIANGCAVRTDFPVTITAEWPAIESWTGEVAGLAEMPADRRWMFVTHGEGPPFGTRRKSLHREARFQVLVAAGEGLDPTWRLSRGNQSVAARVDQVDPIGRRFVVRPAGKVRWVPFQVDADPPWLVRTGCDAQPFCGHSSQHPFAITQGDTVHGVLVTALFGGQQRTLAWWSITDGVDELTLRPAPGRTIELRAADTRSRRVALVGPHGQRDFGHYLAHGWPLLVWVPDGTRAIAVRDDSGAWRELPVADVVVID